MLTNREIYDDTHDQLRDVVRRFCQREIAPHFDTWERNGIVDRALWGKLGQTGLLCPSVPESFGGLDADFRMHTVVAEELAYSGFMGPAADVSVHSDVCLGYLLSQANDEQKARWLPGMVDGSLVCAIAMTEPGTGSDLQGIRTSARRDGDDWIINGAKTFISNGQHADLVIVVTRTSEGRGSGNMSLIVVETDRPGYARGRNLDKLGQISADTSEISFTDVRVPVANTLGPVGQAMGILMTELPQERLVIGVTSIAAAQKAFDITLAYVREREAFGKPIGTFQVTRHKLADMATELSVGWAFIDQCISRHLRGALTTYDASKAKLWATELQGRVVDACVQLHGGYGFMREYEICRLYADARVQRIYGGTSEIMKELISRNL
ncbi:acyl-CoA dehydrogenase family protein [Mesobacterium pallidum]|uniref:acyl-CoA dehydrogenase family protein n=1 Tax=Mesobacterium pallidum TaxID=2872037 RepID=UPI001EE211AD